MKTDTIRQLLEINRRFYLEFGPAFAETRRRIQPGVARTLQSLPADGKWLDLGCGSGALAVHWAERGFSGSYTGLDNSPPLLEEAGRVTSGLVQPGREITYLPADLSNPNWAVSLNPPYDGVLAFAVLHHMPAARLREGILTRVRGLLRPGGWFIHSEWQLQHSPRLMARRLDWSAAALKPEDVEEGDILMDWRHSLPSQPVKTGLRYVHVFNRAELSGMADAAGFEVAEEYESDGAGGRLGLYQVWRAR